MKLLSFHLRGKMAHFRRYYSNSSALTYSVPPRTTIIGMIAGLLGLERDSYYEMFSLEQCHISIVNREPIKKMIQKMNLLKIENTNDFNGSQEYHSQTATEIILPQNIRTGFIDYHIYFHHQDHSIMNQLEQLLTKSKFGYTSLGISFALGTAQHLGWIEYEGIVEGVERESNDFVRISSIIPTKWVKQINFSEMNGNGYRLIKEEIPIEFDKNRRITGKGIGNMIINLSPNPIFIKISKYVQLNDGTSITWVE
ncbi:type I-B CRISPR-associated protein Cas5b [Tepidibacillus fermentans]|uniref:CRISPR-associated protein Cas5h n=1 Tax=Tepidibacillus fermentans TaxID=1281767 RepID=A0A4R3K7K8_9BACI|nr:type I-B CRISPR-associated protein Cas5b [Tepidibacillus fermentans]TCS78788.1 CRISPR-associated protein Cas5h [Tepidibacillus fermentans]